MGSGIIICLTMFSRIFQFVYYYCDESCLIYSVFGVLCLHELDKFVNT